MARWWTVTSAIFFPLCRTFLHQKVAAFAPSVARNHRLTTTTVVFARGRSNKAKGKQSGMKGVKKENLPSKVCVTCGRPFTWRKKWEDCWDEVTTCSKSCNRKRREKKQETNKANRNENYDSIEVGSVSSMGDQVGGLVVDFHETAAMKAKADRKAAKKEAKALNRAKREGCGPSTTGQKPCDRCSKMSDLLIRCQYKDTKANEWHLICGKCWKYASGGVVDGDADHPDYTYGGLWKNRRKQQNPEALGDDFAELTTASQG